MKDSLCSAVALVVALTVTAAFGTETKVTLKDRTTRLVPHCRGGAIPCVETLGAGEAWHVDVCAVGETDLERMLSAKISAEKRVFGGVTAAKTGPFELRTRGLAEGVRRLSVNEGVLRFVTSKQSTATGPELIANPGFEQGGRGWKKYVHPTNVVYATQYSTPAFSYATDSWAFGCAAYDGDFCLRAHNNGGASTQVEFPVAGDYCLTLHVRPRTDNTTVNPLLVMLQAADGATTEIFRGQIAYAPCFLEYGFTFHVAKPGPQTLVLTGLGVPRAACDEKGRIRADYSLILDGVSLRAAVVPPPQPAPAIGAAVAVSVAEGAKLALEGAGTSEVASLCLGGQYVTGEVSEKTHPDYLVGSGTLRVRPAEPFHIQISKEAK